MPHPTPPHQTFGQQPLPSEWQAQITAVAHRYNREYQGKTGELPAEASSLSLYADWRTGTLATRIASPFWALAQPQKNQACLDLGCGVSFLIYPWHDWGAYFYGQEISEVAQAALNQRAPQLNSKLFKGVRLQPAHHLDYTAEQFDWAIATGVSCYYPLAYWEAVITAVKPVLKPTGIFVFDVLNPDAPLAEDWAILETYLGAEVKLNPLSDWEALIKQAGGKIMGRQSGEVFELYKVRF
ncbi:class I SAM-dependent methyltransferase [Trichothermofontia sp.]